jgi:hypothetical protein
LSTYFKSLASLRYSILFNWGAEIDFIVMFSSNFIKN